MKIGFDAKRAVRNFTGLGNYSRFVINNLVRYYPQHTYQLFSSRPITTSELVQSANVNHVVKGTKIPLWRTVGIVNDIKRAGTQIYHGLSNELPYNIHKSGARSVVTMHDLIFLRYPQFYPYIDRKIYDLKARYACRVADRIIAVSECTKRDIIHYYDTDPAKIEVVYQGCFPIFREQANDETKFAVKQKYKLPQHFILSVGSIEDRKNILLIVKALKYLPDDVVFVAIGKQREYAKEVLAYAHENGLSDRVLFRSGVALADLPAVMQSATVFVYPSLYEGFGIPIIEALSSGIPVIAATGSCLEEAGGQGSIYVNPHDENELAYHIERVMNNDDLRKSMSRKGLSYVERFSDKACTDRMMDVYRQLV